MRTPIAPRAASGFIPAASSLLLMSALALGLAGCKTAEEPGAHVAGWTLVDASQRHPIMVSEQPASMVLRVARGSRGLSPSQRAEALRFLGHFRGSDSGNSKLVIGVPSGTANETAAMYAVSDLRHLISELGFPDNTVVVEPYGAGRDSAAPIRLSYLRYVAEGPECGRWPTNLAEDYRNLPYPNFGCAQQRNLASQVANPADLLGPRTMDPADAERRAVVYDRYRQGQPTGAAKSEDERVQVRGAN